VSDDIPIIFADQLLTPDGRQPRAVYLSATATAQMQQYATGGWRVITNAGFATLGQVDLAAVPAEAGDESSAQDADVVSAEAPLWPRDGREKLARWKPHVVKVNCAFHQDTSRCEEIAGTLAGLGYTLLATHWRDDNTYGFGNVARLDHLGAFQPRDWTHMNLIAVRDPARAKAIIVVGRLYVGEERRIAELRLSQAVRGDHIARLEEALLAHQTRV